MGNQVSENKKDVGFRRTSSFSDADVPETASLSDVLKSNVKKPPLPDSTHATVSEGADGHGVKQGKRKEVWNSSQNFFSIFLTMYTYYLKWRRLGPILSGTFKD